MHHAEGFCTTVCGARANVPSGRIGVKQLV